jgi:hypothetical protein
MVIVMEVKLGLQAKEEEVVLSELKNVLVLRPQWSLDWDRGIKAGNGEFKYSP